MRQWEYIVVHCSDSSFGDAAIIKEWHTSLPPQGRGWKDIGYHYVILNGVRKSKAPYVTNDDGKVEEGRDLDTIGAHVSDLNSKALGICLIGINQFTAAQFESLNIVIRELLNQCPTIKHVIGHCDTESGKAQGKTCPNFSVTKFLSDYSIMLT